MADPAQSPAALMPWWVLPGLGSLALLIFAGALSASCFLADDTLRTQMFTGALNLGTLVIGYFFGSSAGSAKKDETIAAQATPSAPMTRTVTTAAADISGAPSVTTETETKPTPPAPQGQ